MPDCHGPCMRHCGCPAATLLLADVALVYLAASAAYLLRTRCLGTPFADSLTPEQREVKRAAARERGAIFASSLAAAAVGVWLLRPLRPRAP